MKRYALVGTGSRAGMFVQAISETYTQYASLVGLCDLSQTRMNWYNCQLKDRGHTALPTYLANDFDRMIAETQPDVVIVSTVDKTHHHYIIRAMELGCDVITEKPMTTDETKVQAIFETIARTGRSLRVTFNYRYAPAYTALRQVIMDGLIGRPLSVNFMWVLDTSHGADYFRRWHREKENSGGLLVHKATHHFDLVNWWLASYPKEVFAMGDLLFYGKVNAEVRGEHYAYSRYTGVDEAQSDPFALFLDKNTAMKGLYLEAEAETGYLRDQNVFGETITIEDVLNVTARYQSGALLSYNLVAFSPWEGMKVAITGDKCRVELEVIENVEHLKSDEARKLSASKGSFKRSDLTVFPMFQAPYDVPIPKAEGGHGGADPQMLEQLFHPSPPHDPFDRAASHIDGAASVLLGAAANQSLANQTLIRIDDLFKL
jgi:predicted dehydrogenase